jgi:hypothetical protein
MLFAQFKTPRNVPSRRGFPFPPFRCSNIHSGSQEAIWAEDLASKDGWITGMGRLDKNKNPRTPSLQKAWPDKVNFTFFVKF